MTLSSHRFHIRTATAWKIIELLAEILPTLNEIPNDLFTRVLDSEESDNLDELTERFDKSVFYEKSKDEVKIVYEDENQGAAEAHYTISAAKHLFAALILRKIRALKPPLAEETEDNKVSNTLWYEFKQKSENIKAAKDILSKRDKPERQRFKYVIEFCAKFYELMRHEFFKDKFVQFFAESVFQRDAVHMMKFFITFVIKNHSEIFSENT